MPKRIERKLFQEAKKEHLSKKRTRAYVYGTLNRIKNMKGKRRKI